MFNGIVESVGIIKQAFFMYECLHLSISSREIFSDLKIGDSISVNGICLTITKVNENGFDVTVVPETLRKTNLRNLSEGLFVNLERSIKVSDRIHGHIIQGHVDGVGEVIECAQEGEAYLLKIKIPLSLIKYIVNKGYIGLDGMSITVIESLEDWITVTIIPHTKKSTIANNYTIGSLINIEVDILGKYLEKIYAGKNHEYTC